MIHRQGSIWFVPSQSDGKRHVVTFRDSVPSCDCQDFELRQLPCKHIFAVQLFRAYELLSTPLPERPETPPAPKRKTYP
jgi:hypothetical protein